MLHSSPRPAWPMALSLVWLATAAPVHAQVSTATIQGTVTDASGVLPGASVTAREVMSGFTHETTSEADGSFTLAGLRPGRYEIKVAVSQYKPEAKTVEVLVGQTVTLNFRINPDVVVTESVTVVGDTRLVETRTSEITTNVTQEQMRYLPQNSRNFLNFAALAPGVRVSDNEFRKEFSAGALPSQNVNVFIDGVSSTCRSIGRTAGAGSSSTGTASPTRSAKRSRPAAISSASIFPVWWTIRGTRRTRTNGTGW